MKAFNQLLCNHTGNFTILIYSFKIISRLITLMIDISTPANPMPNFTHTLPPHFCFSQLNTCNYCLLSFLLLLYTIFFNMFKHIYL